MISTKKEISSALILLLTNIIILGILILFDFLIKYSAHIDYLVIKIILYIIICILAFQVNKRFKFKLLNIITQIIFIPITILTIVIAVAIPILSMQMSIYFYLLLSFIIPMIIYRVDEHYRLINLNFETWLYIILTLGVISAFLLHRQISYLVNKITTYIHNKSKRIEKLKLLELNDYVISLNNIRFTIFFLYLIYIMIINLISFQNSSLYLNQNIDKAVLQSFVTFVAFDRVLSTTKITEFRSSKLLQLLKNSIMQTFQ